MKRIRAGVLEIAYREHGPTGGPPVFLMHGFPYDVHAYAEVATILAAAGCRVIVPYLRGFGPTRFLSTATTSRPIAKAMEPDTPENDAICSSSTAWPR